MYIVKMRWPVITVIAAVLAALANSPASAATATLRCGDTITVNTTLHEDLLKCPNVGIRIGADDITLDLNGHTVAGDGVPFGCSEQQICDVGVENRGHDRVAIMGGNVRDFAVGVSVRDVRHGHLSRLRVSHNTSFGITVDGATDSVVDRTTLSDSGISGMVMSNSRRMQISRDSVSGSHGYALFLSRIDDSILQDNALDGNDHGIGGETITRNVIQ